MDSINVAIADDDPFVRAALREYLSGSPEFRIVGEAEDGDGALQLAEHSPVDVLLLDLSMPRVNGLEVLRRINAGAPRVGVVVLSAYPADSFDGEDAWTAVAAYLDKGCAPEEILQTVRAVAAGRRLRTASELS